MNEHARRKNREKSGRRAENWAAWYLRFKGWRILGRRVRTARGEIDLVAKRGRMVIFVEVKWRSRAEDLDFSIDAYRLRRVINAAHGLASRYCRAGDSCRIDILLLAYGRWPRHIVNAAL